MKYLAFILLVLSLAVNPTRTYSWDADAAKFYPLAVGNKWVYTWYYTFMGNTVFGGYRVSRILSDTVIAGHKYYRFSSNVSGCNDYIFERIDSTSMNVYRRSSGTGTEQLLDSLFAKKQSMFRGKRNCVGFTDPQVTCMDTSAYTFAGNQHRSKMFYADGLVMMSYRLTQNFGVTNIITTEGQPDYKTLAGCVLNGTVYGDTNTLTGVSQIGNEVPSRFSLSQNYPNPFNPITKINFAISGTSVAQTFLSVYDALGREIEVLVNQQLQPGTYEVSWDASPYPSGVYYYRLESGSFTETKKMVLIK